LKRLIFIIFFIIFSFKEIYAHLEIELKGGTFGSAFLEKEEPKIIGGIIGSVEGKYKPNEWFGLGLSFHKFEGVEVSAKTLIIIAFLPFVAFFPEIVSEIKEPETSYFLGLSFDTRFEIMPSWFIHPSLSSGFGVAKYAKGTESKIIPLIKILPGLKINIFKRKLGAILEGGLLSGINLNFGLNYRF
jgi:hypothetical protein